MLGLDERVAARVQAIRSIKPMHSQVSKSHFFGTFSRSYAELYILISILKTDTRSTLKDLHGQ